MRILVDFETIKFSYHYKVKDIIKFNERNIITYVLIDYA
jgi:hypothetical protein